MRKVLHADVSSSFASITNTHSNTLQAPFVGNRDKVQQKIVKEKLKLPSFLSSEAHSLLKGVSFYIHVGLILVLSVKKRTLIALTLSIPATFQLLHKEPNKRLGSGPGGSDEIKNHKWFKPINWRKLEARQIQPSFRPNVAGLTCIANFDECWTKTPVLDSPVLTPAGGGHNNFAGFTYVRPAPILEEMKPSSSRLKD